MATSTDFINIGNVTTTSYTVTRGGSITIQDGGSQRWDVLSRSPQRYLTASIGGGSLVAGNCTSTTTGVDTWITTSTADAMTFPTSPNGARVNSSTWDSQLTANGVVTTEVCSDGVTETPAATAYVFTVN